MSVLLEKIYYTAMRQYGMKLVAGTGGIWNNVSWIHTVEDMEVVDFLKGQELVITTGVKHSEEDQLLIFAQKLYEQEASGFILNIGPHIKEVPQSLIAFGEEKRFPIFALPWEVRLVEFNREFCNQIFQADQQKQNLCSAFRAAVFSPEKIDIYMPVIEQEGISPNEKYCMVKCMPVVEGEEEDIDRSKLFFDLRTYCERIIGHMQKKFVIFRHDFYMTMVIPDIERQEVDKMISEMMDFTKWQNHKGSLYFAVSDMGLLIGELSQHYEILSYMCRMQVKEKRQIWHTDELGIFSLLFSTKNRRFLEKYEENTIGVLEKYDVENATNYCDILSAYLKYNGRMQEVADQCFLHRNTISYHLKKIAEILDCDLYSTEDRVRLYTALKIRDIRLL